MGVEVRGMYVKMACELLETKPAVKEEALKTVLKTAGVSYDKLDPEAWYPIQLFTGIFDSLVRHTSPITARAAIKVIGTKIMPTFKAMGHIPASENTPSTMVKGSKQGYCNSFRGPGVVAPKVLNDTPNEIVVQLDSLAGVPSELNEGAYMGILQACGVKNAKVVSETRDGHFVFTLTWS
jgi:uncharacterized protein (TIGR02265 family)